MAILRAEVADQRLEWYGILQGCGIQNGINVSEPRAYQGQGHTQGEGLTESGVGVNEGVAHHKTRELKK